MLLLFIFGGAIVGEMVALSMIVSVAGPGVIGKLYLVNGLVLFLLPPLFFNNIDRFNRGKMLSIQLVVIASILFIYLLLIKTAHISAIKNSMGIILHCIYPISYLSKTILFLTFWTLANDICYKREVKREYPKIAAWGFAGGLAGAVLARALLEIVSPEMIIALWASSFCIAYGITRKITAHYSLRLLPKEFIPRPLREKKTVINDVRSVLSIDLVRYISCLYFLIFIAIFLCDYLFWKTCYVRFVTSTGLASFQFSFYITHGIITIAGLLLVTPLLISKLGFIRLFLFLPYSLLFGSAAVLGLTIAGVSPYILFVGFVINQFARYVLFENAFSPIFQMFFASISKEKRGRAKTIIDGIVKPSAILTSGILLIFLEKYFSLLLCVIIVLSLLMLWVVSRIRISYMKGLTPHLPSGYETDEVIAQIGSHYDQRLLSLVREYSLSTSTDLRCFAVRILAQLGSKQALKIVIDIYESNTDPAVKEAVACSLKNFYWYDTKVFVDTLLRDTAGNVRCCALRSLNAMNCYWKEEVKEAVKPMLYENDLPLQVEAASFLWSYTDAQVREGVLALVKELLNSATEEKRSAGISLSCLLKVEGWEDIIRENIRKASMSVFAKSIEAVVSSARKEAALDTLKIVEHLSRRHIEITSDVIQKIGKPAVDTVLAFLKQAKNPRMIFELIHALRIMRDADTHKKTAGFSVDPKTERAISSWISGELQQAYYAAYLWFSFKSEQKLSELTPGVQMLNDAIKDQVFHICGWALDTIALLEPHGGLVAIARKDLDIKEQAQRINMIEIVESLGATKFRNLILPLLEFESWPAIARHGEEMFGFKAPDRTAIEYFLHSDNEWICLCMLYCIAMLPGLKEVIHLKRDNIEALQGSPNTYISEAAGLLISEKMEKKGCGMNSFTLLETVLFFKKTALFQNVPAEKLIPLAEISQLTSYKKGTAISNEGSISDHLYIVKSGSLKIIKVKNTVKTILSIIRSGEAYGEIGLFNQAPRSASAVANEDCEIYVIQRSSLKNLLLDIPEVGYNLLVVFGDKLKKSSEEITLLHTMLADKIRNE